ncbi:MAG: hypothetical protein FJ006_05330 [Chloroflexi bacterium]|nr:hypothetical protein [Chloroflexota bacterium]
MTAQKGNDLRKKIIEEMTSDYSSALEKNFDLARQFIRITTDGKVDVLVKDKLTGKEAILLYLIGKLYAKEAGYAATDDVGNEELMDELGVRIGSLLPWLKDLRDDKQIKQIRRGKYTYHTIMLNEVENTLKDIAVKIEKGT